MHTGESRRFCARLGRRSSTHSSVTRGPSENEMRRPEGICSGARGACSAVSSAAPVPVLAARAQGGAVSRSSGRSGTFDRERINERMYTGSARAADVEQVRNTQHGRQPGKGRKLTKIDRYRRYVTYSYSIINIDVYSQVSVLNSGSFSAEL